MTDALARGLKTAGYPSACLAVSNRSADKRDAMAAALDIGAMPDNIALIGASDIVVLAVKPQQMAAVMEECRDALLARQPVLVSLAIGLTFSRFQQWLGGNCPMVRAMPNVASGYGVGATGLIENGQLNAEQKAAVTQLFEASGLAVWVSSENELDIVSTLSGSGPAYQFLLWEMMEAAAVKMGLSPKTANQLMRQTALGAATMAAHSDATFAAMRARVTSKKGSTEQAIAAFNAADIEKTVANAMQAAYDRTVEFAKEQE